MTMRKLDQDECRAAGLEPEDALRMSRELSDAFFVATAGAEPLAQWGYRRINSTTAQVWMLSFEGVDTRKTMFARESLRLQDFLLEEFDTLRCEVWSGHTVARMWLEWLGFRAIADTYHNEALFIIMQKDRD